MEYGSFSPTPYPNSKFYHLYEIKDSSSPDVPYIVFPDHPVIFDFLASLEDSENDVLDPGESFVIKGCSTDDFTGLKLNGNLLQRDVDYYVNEHPDGGISLLLDDDIYDSLDEESTHFIQFYLVNGHGKLEFKKASSAVSAITEVPATGGAPLMLMPLMLAALALCIYLLRKRLIRTDI